jgi:hypothetical protein
MRGSFALWPAVLLCAPTLVWAEAAPPEGSKPLTEILRPIEAQPDFAYFEEIELEGGKYKIEYFKKDRSKQKIEVDPLTGAPSKPAEVAKPSKTLGPGGEFRCGSKTR